MAAISSLTIRSGASGLRIGEAAGPTERKTGLYVRNVETPQLVRDQRGWLKVAS